ncbi:MAG TPA: flagellar basal body P-ring protein FlgI [Pirellulales bacterium]|nr:flagellar basal body P-ring protein FlgI [Pirellulales bacterium]
MKPFDADLLSHLGRREFLVCGSLLFLAGCVAPAVRSQSPEDAEMASIEKQVRLIEAVAVPFGMNYVSAEGPALIVGLKNTGSDPPPDPKRAELLADMKARGVVNPNTVLASPSTSLVWVKVFLPPGAQKGDPLDITVRVPPQSETTSLWGGWLMEARLKEKALLMDNQVHDGHVLAIGEGPLLVDPPGSADDKASQLRALVLGGARVLRDRNLGLSIKDADKSVFLSKQIGDALNRRFHTFAHGTQQGVATPKTDTFIELQMHPRYKHNLPRYIRVVRSVAIHETPTEQIGRLKLLEKQLLDAVTCETAALRLEALGKDGMPVLKIGMKSSDPEVRFYSAEALAYLDDASSAKPLADAARNIPAFRAYALTALSSLNDVESSDELRALLDVPSAETRYGAFRALWGMNERDPLVRGENLGGKFNYCVLNTAGPPMIHVTRSFRAEVVMFGPGQVLALPVSLEAGKSIVINGRDADQVTVSRFAVGEADQKRVVSNQVDDVIRAIVELGGDYPDVVQFLQQAKANRALSCRLEVDALPNPDRHFDRERGEAATAGSDDPNYQVTTPLPNLFSNSAPK